MLLTFMSSRLMLALRPFLPYLLGVLVIVVSAYLLYSKGYSNGSSDKDAEYQVVIAEERDRVLSANLEALETARETAKFLQLKIDVVLESEYRLRFYINSF